MPNNNLPAQGERLTEEQVNQVLNAWDFLEFSKAYRGSYYNAYYTPDIVNQQMKNINMNPVDADLSQLEKALSTPKSSEDILRHYAEGIEVKNMFYKRLLRYFSDMASFNLTFDPINVTKDSEFTSPQFKKDLAVLDNFCSIVRTSVIYQYNFKIRIIEAHNICCSVFNYRLLVVARNKNTHKRFVIRINDFRMFLKLAFFEFVRKIHKQNVKRHCRTQKRKPPDSIKIALEYINEYSHAENYYK